MLIIIISISIIIYNNITIIVNLLVAVVGSRRAQVTQEETHDTC